MQSPEAFGYNDRSEEREAIEQAVFQEFVESIRPALSIVTTSISSRHPPEPDISCLDSNCCPLYFELSELADETMKESQTDSELTLESLVGTKGFAQLDVDLLNAKYDRCYIDITRPKKNVHTVLIAIARYLLYPDVQIPPVGASTLLINVRNIPGTLSERGFVQIYAPMPSLRDPGTGWQVNSGGSFGDCIREALDKKVSRPYSLRGKILRPQLLLYYNGDPPYMESFPCECDVESMKLLWEKKFTDVWVLDARRSTIVVHAVV